MVSGQVTVSEKGPLEPSAWLPALGLKEVPLGLAPLSTPGLQVASGRHAERAPARDPPSPQL